MQVAAYLYLLHIIQLLGILEFWFFVSVPIKYKSIGNFLQDPPK